MVIPPKFANLSDQKSSSSLWLSQTTFENFLKEASLGRIARFSFVLNFFIVLPAGLEGYGGDYWAPLGPLRLPGRLDYLPRAYNNRAQQKELQLRNLWNKTKSRTPPRLCISGEFSRWCIKHRKKLIYEPRIWFWFKDFCCCSFYRAWRMQSLVR